MGENELALFSGTEKTVTTKELAENLGVTPQTIRDTVERLGLAKSILQVKIRGQNSFAFNAEQATAIKIELQNHSKVAQNGFDTLTISNDLEAWELQKRLDAYKDKRIAELTAENKALEEKNGRLMHTQKTYTASEVAKEVGLSSAIKLNQFLKDKGIQYCRNGTWLPIARYAEEGYYEIKQDVLENGIVVYNSRFTQKGREFVLKLFEKSREAA